MTYWDFVLSVMIACWSLCIYLFLYDKLNKRVFDHA